MTGFDAKLALFLGAGFSKEWGLPLTSEIMNPGAAVDFPGVWQVDLLDRVRRGWDMARTNKPNISVDEFGKCIQRSGCQYDLSVNDFTTFLALKLSRVHWTVGRARETKWGGRPHPQAKDHPRSIPRVSPRHSQITAGRNCNHKFRHCC
jgi:hypothetical protein